MEKSFGLLFYLKKPKGYRSGEVPVYLRIMPLAFGILAASLILPL